MKGDRGSRILAAGAAIWLAAACGGAAATQPGSQAPAATETAGVAPGTAATLSPLIDPAGAAIGLIEALGGEVPRDAEPQLASADPDTGLRGVYVVIGDWQVEWDSLGVLREASHLPVNGATPSPAAALSEAQIRGRVAGLLKAIGVEMGPPDDLRLEADGWTAEWPRRVDGVPAHPNGTLLWLNLDGSFGLYAYSWNPLAEKPATVITAAQSMTAIPGCNGQLGSPESCEARLVWHLPSTGSADAQLVLCWLVAKKGGSDWSVMVDAGTGETVDVQARID